MKNKALTLWESVWVPGSDKKKSTNFKNGIKSTIRLFFAATERFRKDEDLIRAASISYALVVSFIPTLIVGLLLAANFINIKDYEELAKEYVRKNAIPMDVGAYFKIVYELLNNTAALTGIGFLFVLFSTTSVLRNLEEAMNKIWHIKKKRPFIQKVAEFIMIIIFGPILLVIGLSTGQNILNQFSAPTLLKIDSSNDKEYILGNKRIFLERVEDKWKYSDLLKKVDFDFQKEPIVFDPETNSILSEKELQPLAHRIKKSTRSEIIDSSLIDFATVGDNLYILVENGTLLYSRNNGEYWMARKFQRKQLNILVRASFKKIYFFNDKEGVIIGKSGLILKTEDAGETWIPKYNSIVDADLHDIAEIRQGEHLIIGESLSAYLTVDNGNNWRKFNPIANIDSYDKENLNSIEVLGENIFICGDSGVILKSKNNGRTWTKKNLANKKYDFHDILFLDNERGIMVGDSGNIRYTLDGGSIWRQARTGTEQDLFSAHYSEKSNQIFIAGQNYHILSNKEIGKLDHFVIIEKTPIWRILISAFGRFFLPFLVLWLIFFFVYQIMPFTNVRFSAAAIGAFCTSTALVFFLLGFQVYVSYFSAGKFAIYGTLAAIPLALLMIYISTIIVLYGCEISFLIQHPNLIMLSYQKRNVEELEKHQIWQGIQILYHIHENFNKGKGETTDKDLIKKCKVDPSELDRIISIYIKNNMLARTENGGLAPLLSSEKITLDKLVDILSPAGFDITDYDSGNILVKELKPIFENYKMAKTKIFKEKTIADLLKS
ncbi:MAG: YihY/virulence factor BrkB family protein [Leptospira sp.]|nr:YihY/virulence factor BrkB family protein [Leptospira sp.]